MRIINSIKDIGFCFEDGCFSKTRWDIYIGKIYHGLKELVEADSGTYNFNRDILPILNSVNSDQSKLEELHSSFCKATYLLEERILKTVHTEINADIVLYIGLCNGAGWATKINDKPVVLLGIEKILELGWTGEAEMSALLYHELGHLWHIQNRTTQTNVDTLEHKALWQLYSEGVAMHFEQMLCGDEQFYHQNKDGWLLWCIRNRNRLFNEYISRIENKANVQDFFGDWSSFEGYSDVGYFLGAELVRKAAESYTVTEILEFSLSQIKQLLIKCASE